MKNTRNSREIGIQRPVTFTISPLREKSCFKNNLKVTLLPPPSSNFFSLEVPDQGKIPLGKDTEEYIHEEAAVFKNNNNKKKTLIYSLVINDKSYHKEHYCGIPE